MCKKTITSVALYPRDLRFETTFESTRPDVPPTQVTSFS